MHGSSEISLESLEYLPRCVFLGKPWIPSSAKPVKAPLSFLASLQHLLSGFSAFRSMLLRIQHTLGGQSRAARRARSLRFLFIWVLHLLAALVFQNSSFCLPSPVRLAQGLGCGSAGLCALCWWSAGASRGNVGTFSVWPSSLQLSVARSVPSGRWGFFSLC